MLDAEQVQEKLAQWPLAWITREKLTEIVKKLVAKATPKTRKLSHKNIIDPFSALFDMAVSEMDSVVWEKAEVRRQQQKTLQNAVGRFHQSVLGSVNGWEDLGVGRGVDVVNHERKIFAEVKNKFNTVRGADKIAVFNELAVWRSSVERRDYTGYYVQIITKNRFNRLFSTTDSKTQIKASSDHIREIDGASFYEMVTGSPTALKDLYAILPYVLQEVCPAFDAESVCRHPNYEDFFVRAFENKTRAKAKARTKPKANGKPKTKIKK